MKLYITSDWHLEQYVAEVKSGYRKRNLKDWCMELFGQETLECDADPGNTLILAGDILCTKHIENNSHPFDFLFEYLHEQFGHSIVAVAGNHEFYGEKDMPTALGKLKKYYERFGITLLDGETDYAVPFTTNLIIVGNTLWTNQNNSDHKALTNANWYMNDFRGLITIDSVIHKKFYAEDSVKEHYIQFYELKKRVSENPDEEFIVVTHHAPSYMSVSPRYAGNTLNPSFSSNLDNFILDNENIRTWIHGHHHSTSDYMLGKCNVIANPVGYCGENSQPKIKIVDF